MSSINNNEKTNTKNHLIASVNSKIKNNCYLSPIKNIIATKKIIKEIIYLGCAKQIKNIRCCLNINTIQKIIQRFLLEKKLSKSSLAAILDITTKELELLILKQDSLKIVTKINLSLIELYCRTNWNNKNN